jgi:hypothetical protein
MSDMMGKIAVERVIIYEADKDMNNFLLDFGAILM